ncbi:MAG TPA: peptidylprolyl isomerase [Spirochaetota bacterium]|nr:peptidylprolyl isomerase [Spirochaetota bacterium]HOL56719.1 peptidylprolyl isomerase [Spirochaetota bacterium]HPP04126.1 peptidylprolyl isomerase [Spirochaetota bacterium]
MKKFILIGIILNFIYLSYTQTQINVGRVAKVGSEIILKSDVLKRAKLYNISYEEALKELVEDALLYIGAKISVTEPTEEEVLNQIRDDKAYYASRVNKDVSAVSDDEFLKAILINNLSMKTYKEYVKRQLWISKFLSYAIENEKLKKYTPSKEEIEKLKKQRPDLFEEREGVIISMIYFSFYDNNGKLLEEKEREAQKKRAEKCLALLNKGLNFEDAVTEYSNDLISKNSTPKGRAGFIAFDDPRVKNSLTEEILLAFKSASIGLIDKIFTTNNGLYIFKIDSKVLPKKLSEEEANYKAESILISEYNTNIKESVRKNLIEELKQKIEIIYY